MYLIFDDYNKTCVDNCTKYGRNFTENSYKCAPIRKNNGTREGDDDNKNDNLLLWIFVGIIGIILLIISIIICKKCCCNKNDSAFIEEITTEIDEKELIN